MGADRRAALLVHLAALARGRTMPTGASPRAWITRRGGFMHDRVRKHRVVSLAAAKFYRTGCSRSGHFRSGRHAAPATVPTASFSIIARDAAG
jgi:hypothetical protein